TATSPHPLDGTIAEWVWLLPVLPLLGVVVNGAVALWSARSAHNGPSTAARSVPTLVAPGVMAVAFGLAVAVFMAMRAASPDAPFIRNYGEWMPVGDLVVNWGFQLDQLSMVMALVVTGVGFLIHVFSIGYMRDDAGYAR